MSLAIPSLNPDTPTSVGFPVEEKYTYDPNKDYFKRLSDELILMIVDLIGPTPEDLRAFTLVNRRIYAISSDRSHLYLDRSMPGKMKREPITDEYIYALIKRFRRLKTITSFFSLGDPTEISDQAFGYLIAKCEYLENLSLSSIYEFTDDSLLCLSQCKNLTRVSFAFDDITDSGVFTLTKACALRHIEFIECLVTPRVLSHIGKNCKHMKSIHIVIKDDLTPDEIIASNDLTLDEIAANIANWITDVARGCSKLELFGFESSLFPITDVSMKSLAEGCHQLRGFNLLGDIFHSFVGTFHNLKTLRIFNFVENAIVTDEQMSLIAFCCPKLEELSILYGYLVICPEKGFLLPNKFQNLRFLDITETSFISEAFPERTARFISFIILNCPKLNRVYLTHTGGQALLLREIPSLQLLLDRNIEVIT